MFIIKANHNKWDFNFKTLRLQLASVDKIKLE